MRANTERGDADVAGLLAEHYREPQMDETLRQDIRRRTRDVVASRARPWAWIVPVRVVAICATVAVVALLLRRPFNVAIGGKGMPADDDPTAVATVAALQGPAADGAGRAIRVGDRLKVDGVLHTGGTGRVTLVTRRGAELTLGAGTDVAFVRIGALDLRAGRIYCTNRGHEIAQIGTPAGRIRPLGTVLDAEILNATTVAVTVVEGKVELSNAKGHAVVAAGSRTTLSIAQAPSQGTPVDVHAATAWYDGRSAVQTDSGDIVYTVDRQDGLATELWAVRMDGTHRRRLKTYIGFVTDAGPWVPGDDRINVRVMSALWHTPDQGSHIAHGQSGQSIIEKTTYLVDPATLAETASAEPESFRVLYSAMSPDMQRVVFCGHRREDRLTGRPAEGGVWVYERGTGEYRKLLGGWIKTAPAWAPDSRRIAFSSGEEYGLHHPLVILDAVSGQVTDLNVQGAGAAFSPDGKKLAYCGDFRESGTWSGGVPVSGSIFVKDLDAGTPPVRLSPTGQGSVRPRWSPDGTRVLFETMGTARVDPVHRSPFALCIAQADGSGMRQVCSGTGLVNTAQWTRDGDTILAATRDLLYVVSASSGAVVRTVRLDRDASVLSAEERTQTDAALDEVREAIYRYALGSTGGSDGATRDRRTDFRTCATILSTLRWRFPLAQLSGENVMAYANKADGLASKPDTAR